MMKITRQRGIVKAVEQQLVLHIFVYGAVGFSTGASRFHACTRGGSSVNIGRGDNVAHTEQKPLK